MRKIVFFCIFFLHLIKPFSYCKFQIYPQYTSIQQNAIKWYFDYTQTPIYSIFNAVSCDTVYWFSSYFWKIAIYSDNGKPQSIFYFSFLFFPRTMDLTNIILRTHIDTYTGRYGKKKEKENSKKMNANMQAKEKDAISSRELFSCTIFALVFLG